MKENLGSLIKKEDFENLCYQVLILNNTSGTNVSKSSYVRLGMLNEKLVSMIVPKASCAKGHSLTLYFFEQEKVVYFKNFPHVSHQKLASIVVTGVVEEKILIENEDNCSVQVLLQHYNVKEWDKIIQKIESRQCQVSEAMIKLIGA